MSETEAPKPRRRRRVLIVTLVGLLFASGLAYWTLLRAAPIDLAAYPARPAVPAEVKARADLSFSLIHTGYTDSPEAMVFRGGALLETHRTQHSGVLIRHPDGLLLIDGGLGAEAGEDLASMPAWLRPMFRFEDHRPARGQLVDAGIDPDSIARLVLTHMHWDHASALHDFPKARVVTTKAERDHALSEAAEPPSFIKRQYEDIAEERYELARFDGPAYEGFERSQDLFGDGAVVLVPMAGHTPGALGVFLNLSSERRYFFVGDTVWSAKAIAALAEKMPVARWLADSDAEGVRGQVARLHRLQARLPKLVIVPAHDAAVHAALPVFPKFSSR